MPDIRFPNDLTAYSSEISPDDHILVALNTNDEARKATVSQLPFMQEVYTSNNFVGDGTYENPIDLVNPFNPDNYFANDVIKVKEIKQGAGITLTPDADDYKNITISAAVSNLVAGAGITVTAGTTVPTSFTLASTSTVDIIEGGTGILVTQDTTNPRKWIISAPTTREVKETKTNNPPLNTKITEYTMPKHNIHGEVKVDIPLGCRITGMYGQADVENFICVYIRKGVDRGVVNGELICGVGFNFSEEEDTVVTIYTMYEFYE